jgi:hypothetical protein
MNGKPGDHPITDIVRYHIARCGDPWTLVEVAGAA